MSKGKGEEKDYGVNEAAIARILPRIKVVEPDIYNTSMLDVVHVDDICDGTI